MWFLPTDDEEERSRRSRKWQGRERKREGMMMVQTRGMNSMPPAVDIKRGGERREADQGESLISIHSFLSLFSLSFLSSISFHTLSR